MKKWVRRHRRDRIFPAILDSVLKEVVEVGTGGPVVVAYFGRLDWRG